MNLTQLSLFNFRFWAVFILSSGITYSLNATHNLAGQITCAQSDPNQPNTYLVTLTTYTDPAPAGVDRCSADIEIWTTGASPTLITTLANIPRSNGPIIGGPINDCPISDPNVVIRDGIVVKGTVKENIYSIEYTFPGPGEYELRYTDMYRHGSVVNIDNPDNQTFYVETRLFITPAIVGDNNTPILLNRPLQDACSGKIWVHNPGGFDPDGDSLVYELRPSFQYETPNPPSATSGYIFPDDAQFGPNATFNMDPETGLITWDVPQTLGIYNFAFTVKEYRDGALLGYIVRDMAVWVIDCDNNPPIVETISDTCIYAGETLSFDYKAWDPDVIDSLYLSLNNGGLGNNGPFSVDNPATIQGAIVDFVNGNIPYSNLPQATINNGFDPVDTIKGTITWDTECDNIRKQFYQVDLVASDNRNYSLPTATSNTTLEAHRAVTIRVVPPPPSDLTITQGLRTLTLDWAPTFCGDLVVGYNIYRKVGPEGFSQDSICCESSPQDMGFELLTFQADWLNTSFVDSLTDVSSIIGEEICYVVTAMYDDQNNPGLPILESCATNEACAEIEAEPIYMTNDSVSVTSATNGEIFVSWSQPTVSEFFPAPITYRLYRANNNAFPAIAIADLGFNDTTFTDTGIDTEIRGYNYRVEMFDALGLRIPTGDVTNVGSSIFLTASGGNNLVQLSWTEFVPWQNTNYEVWRSDNGGPFAVITNVPGTGANTHSYTDSGLNPNFEYCYFIRSEGSHNEPGIKPNLINDSQRDCAFARDEEAPCPPTVVAGGNCDSLKHEILVSRSDLDCASDTDFITVLFANNSAGPYMEVASYLYTDFDANGEIRFERLFENGSNTFAGCYVVTATDTLGNTSELSEPWCIDFCPRIELPNIFTPNADGVNDIFRPVTYQDIALREFIVFDRWGRRMYTNTSNISELWTGQIDFSNQQAVEGVYYYYIRYEELGINGNTQREAKGWVMLAR
ncbi:MAG: gliding motility-associated C-terminal domain-containing protein [Bacteroidota bacterium]